MTSFPTHRRSHSTAATRAGFTLVELLIVVGLLALLMTLIVVASISLGDSAKERATRATLANLDGLLQERLEAFSRLMEKQVSNRGENVSGWLNVNRAAQRLQSDAGGAVSFEQARTLVIQDRYRGVFPQRVEDLHGLDGSPGTADDSPLLTIWQTALNNGTSGNHQRATESIELFLLSLKSTNAFGFDLAALDELDLDAIQDTDGDGLDEFVDAWGNPIRFYNTPTRLVRPGNYVENPPAPDPSDGIPDGIYENAPITPEDQRLAGLFMPGVSPGADPVPPDAYANILNQDPRDSTDRLNGRFLNDTAVARAFGPEFYHDRNTYHLPLLVSAGSDRLYGMYPPSYAGTDPPPGVRNAQPTDDSEAGSTPGQPVGGGAAVFSDDDHPIFDNITNRQRVGAN